MLCHVSFVAFALAQISMSMSTTADGGVGVLLPKRQSLVTADGTFDHNKAIQHNLKVAK